MKLSAVLVFLFMNFFPDGDEVSHAGFLRLPRNLSSIPKSRLPIYFKLDEEIGKRPMVVEMALLEEDQSMDVVAFFGCFFQSRRHQSNGIGIHGGGRTWSRFHLEREQHYFSTLLSVVYLTQRYRVR